MTGNGTPPPPRGLSRRSRDFWRQIIAEYELQAPHFEILRATCRTMDRLDDIQAALAGQPITVEGSKGQPRPHPLLAEERGLNVTLARLIRELDLEGDTEPSPRPPALRSR